ncbi:TrbG/VirB9 family P-type conjugative transfer protein [Caulobacter sp. UNC279MFTsu5.1]|uniref:TrbG/VirB9 family P-type conjugative transfer protein n=1 Tax=Caulobacter sp. UNC279MFTsu5.1 TaxID=1502775 RepID=UPI0008E606C7|nr:TrbG/VirB9 family P-type conjugative transfer protein [Caulobacter sp. UNC279MFTsu5.1]SFI53447.1 type IV secretion system protein VirB9 [Caulobacter sp. UNC279MFTsu5.1]
MTMRSLMVSAALAALDSVSGQGVQAAPRERQPQAGAPVEFKFVPGGLYPVLAAPGRITAITLEPGETLSPTNPIAAGDTARWVIGDTASGEGRVRRVQVLIKPTLGSLSTNLVINTSRRTYFLDVRASDRAYLTEVRWRYGDAVPLVAAPPAPLAPARAEVSAGPPRLNFAYRITGSRVLRPVRVYDDGVRTVLEFGPRIAMADLPPLYRLAANGKSGELVNYSVDGRTLRVDGLVERAELRLGRKGLARRVRIERLAEAGQ